MKRGIIITSFGDRREQLKELIPNIREFTDIEIMIICDDQQYKFQTGYDVKWYFPNVAAIKWKGHPRYGVRNANYWKAWGAICLDYDSVMCIDDDMKIVDAEFVNGFSMAENFGICVPVNPRVYNKYNAMGEDTREQDRADILEYEYLPACNMSPMFASRIWPQVHRLMEAFMNELVRRPCRGTLAFAKASWNTKVHPVYLPEQWCICRANAKYIKNYSFMYREKEYKVKPLMLHWGQPEVREIFGED